MKRWVVSDACGKDAPECDFVHFWTPGGLTTGASRPLIEMAKRCGWTDTIEVRATTHRAAVVEACRIFTEKRKGRRPRPTKPPPEHATE